MGHPRVLEVLGMMPLLRLMMMKLLLLRLMGPDMMLLVKRSQP
jgi:hypothetical protein